MGAIILGGMVAWFAYDMSRHVVAIQSARGTLSARASGDTEFSRLKSQANQAAQELPFLTSLLPSEGQLINFPRESGILARQNTIELGFSFGASTAGTTSAPGFTAFMMSGQGALNNWFDFMRALETSNYVIGIDVVRLTTTDGKIYNGNINGKVFSQ